jgi:hypothetical protein
MGGFQSLIRNLRRAEEQLVRQLEGIRNAISSLEFGSAASPGIRIGGRKRSPQRREAGRRRTLSAKARAAISRAQKKRWAKLRKEAQ